MVLAASPHALATAAMEPNDISQVATLSSADVANGQVTVLEINLRKLGPTAADPKARFRQNTIALFQHPLRPSGIYCGLIGIPLSATPGFGIGRCGAQAAEVNFKHSDLAIGNIR